MASFLTSLFTSIFTPGPTPVLLLATNISFGALQLVLALLLVFTHSLHFLILSLLSSGLWWAINWFAAEVRAVERVEREATAIREREGMETRKEVNEGEGSEVETEGEGADDGQIQERGSGVSRERKEESERAESGNESEVVSKDDVVSRETEGVRKRRSIADAAGDLSTDSEWDKVSEEGDLDR